MENLYVNGRSLQYIDRNLKKQGISFESHFKFQKRMFVPFKTERIQSESVGRKRKPIVIKSRKNFHTEIIETASVPHKRKILKRPKRFKNYYTDREPLEVTCFEFPRFGEQLLCRGRQTLCKYYNSNEIINESLMKIKSAETAHDFEKVINYHIRNRQQVGKCIEPYHDTSSILAPPLRPLVSETCLCTKDYYRLNYILEEKSRQQCNISPHSSRASSNAIKNISVTSTSIDNFICLASECYIKCIQYYLNNLNDCNRKVEKRQSPTDHTAIKSEPLSSSEHKSFKADENTLTNHLNKLNINLQSSCDDSSSISDKSKKINTQKNTGQSIVIHSKCISPQAMSCSDTNNNNTESTNHIRDPPKIIFSDFSTVNQPTQDKSDKDLSDNRSAIAKNCLNIPNTHYCSEARPP